MTQHVVKVASVCFYHIRRLRQIRRRVGQDSQEVTTRLVLAMVTTRLDYCNSILARLPQSTLGGWSHCREFRTVRHVSSSRLQSRALGSRHASSTATALAANPSSRSLQFKLLCTLMYVWYSQSSLVSVQRTCLKLSDAVQSVAITSTRAGLRSAETINYATKLNYWKGDYEKIRQGL